MYGEGWRGEVRQADAHIGKDTHHKCTCQCSVCRCERLIFWSYVCVDQVHKSCCTTLADSTKCCRKSFLTSCEAHKLWQEVVQCSVCWECWGRLGNAHPALLRRRSCPRVPAREASERCQKVFLKAFRPAICPAFTSGNQAGTRRGTRK